jgi:hypothetical protein
MEGNVANNIEKLSNAMIPDFSDHGWLESFTLRLIARTKLGRRSFKCSLKLSFIEIGIFGLGLITLLAWMSFRPSFSKASE